MYWSWSLPTLFCPKIDLASFFSMIWQTITLVKRVVAKPGWNQLISIFSQNMRQIFNTKSGFFRAMSLSKCLPSESKYWSHHREKRLSNLQGHSPTSNHSLKKSWPCTQDMKPISKQFNTKEFFLKVLQQPVSLIGAANWPWRMTI